MSTYQLKNSIAELVEHLRRLNLVLPKTLLNHCAMEEVLDMFETIDLFFNRDGFCDLNWLLNNYRNLWLMSRNVNYWILILVAENPQLATDLQQCHSYARQMRKELQQIKF